MYVIKHIPEDFIVEEIPSVIARDEGNYRYVVLKKRDYTTEKAIDVIAQKMHISPKSIGFCGNKDRKAITKQLISFPSTDALPTNLPEEITLEHYGYGKDRLRLGQLVNNTFTITVRNLDKIPEIVSRPILNLFGPQRFSENNVTIGRLLSKHDYANALVKLKEQRHHETELADERLLANKNDIVGALRAYRKLTLLFYVHAYQSWLWNQAAQKLRDSSREQLSIPGFGSDFDTEEEKMYGELFETEKIVLRDFVHKSFPEINSEGGMRRLFIVPENLTVDGVGDDEHFSEKKKCTIRFSLPPGSYATVVVDHYFL